MKLAAYATAALLATTVTASAIDLGAGLSVGAETDASYDFDAENFNITVSPELGYAAWGAQFTADMDLAVYDQQEFVLGDAFESPKLNFSVEYPLGLIEGMEVYGETTYDWDASDVVGSKVGVSFNF